MTSNYATPSDMSETSAAIDLCWTAARLAHASQGQWIGGQPNLSAHPRIVTDTRQVQAGDVFLALAGERFDAHDFVAQAEASGAVAAIVSRLGDADLPQLLVDDTRLALGRLGQAQRQAMPMLQVAAMTGSSGKTTTKQMLGSILSLSAPILMTRGNLNNDLGVPMMLLELEAKQQYAVMELGANHVGEIAYTTALVQPQVAGVLNIGTAHVGEFGGRDGIARAKSEIFSGLPADGVAVLPVDGEFIEVVAAAAAPYQQIRFGTGGEVWAEAVELLADRCRFILCTATQQCAVELPFAGAHNIDNALAAAAFALAFDIPVTQIAQGLSQASNIKGRLAFIRRDALTLIDDTYNANPHSMRAAAQVLCAQAGLRVMLTGDIGELGEIASQEHYALGAALALLPIDHLLSVGQYAPEVYAGWQSVRATGAAAYTDKASLMQGLRAIVEPMVAQDYPVACLFKGSRTATMETLISDLLAG